MRQAGLTAAALAIVLGLVSLGLAPALFALVVACGAALLVVALARRQIGGQTGDVGGAAAACGRNGRLGGASHRLRAGLGWLPYER